MRRELRERFERIITIVPKHSALERCAYATYKATDSFSDSRRNIEKREYDKALRMLKNTIKFLEEVEETCKINLSQTKAQVGFAITETTPRNWEEALRLVKDAEDDFEHKLLEATRSSKPPNNLTIEEREKCRDILKKLRETNQIYIIDHDVPLSISKTIFSLLDARRRLEARKRGVPEGQFEFEDIIGHLLGLL